MMGLCPMNIMAFIVYSSLKPCGRILAQTLKIGNDTSEHLSEDGGTSQQATPKPGCSE
jgi:hypothetical protein